MANPLYDDEEFADLTRISIDQTGKPESSFTLLAQHCLELAVPNSDKNSVELARSILTVAVPSDEWLSDIRLACQKLWPDANVLSFAAGAKRKNYEVTELLKHHVQGHRLVLVSDSPDSALPEPLLRASARRYVVAPPQMHTIELVAAKIVRGSVGEEFADIDVSSLGFVSLCLGLVVGDTADEAAGKLRSAASAANANNGGAEIPALRDVHGYGNAKGWAQSFVADMKNFKAGKLAWSNLDHGCLLFGPPGTGKTLLARILAKEAGIPIIETSISSYFASGSGDLSAVIRQQRQTFAKAASLAPCLLFIDELDALPSRDSTDHNRDFWKPVITDLLLLLDSAMADRVGVTLIGATNRIQDIDPALIRAGRMDSLLYIPPPDADGLLSILRQHLRGELLHEELMPLVLARPNSTGADVVGWLKAARRRSRAAGRQLLLEDLQHAIIGADNRPVVIRQRVAIHEAGHVVAAKALGIRVPSVTISASEGLGGQTSIASSPHGISTKSNIEAEVVVLLAGKAAEAILIGGETATGSGGSITSDLALATEKLQLMHQQYGMGADLIYRSGPMDAKMTKIVEVELKRLYGLAVGIMITHRDVVAAIATELLEHVSLNEHRIDQMFVSTLAGAAPHTA